ncbi:putative permease, DMT superfamily [Cryptosporangium arvum DSM 44712]|uniref:Putative permease, DMT superfamily n=1 Tax=Cryptosporangium arvum DSM 44712 TaxID=927661 RepID=A0A010ZWJ0_9ACTN|nr:putative permease, DMT superfamily [Cryptosporangium arvum DSM 44712]
MLIATAAAPATWGTTYLVTTEFLPAGRPLLAGVLRALPAGLLLLAIVRVLPRGSWWWRSAVLGTLNIGAFFALLFLAAYRLPGGVAAIAGAIQPLLVAALAVPALGERLRPRMVAAGAAGVAGVALVVLTAQARLDALGITAALGGAASMALGIVLTKRWSSPTRTARGAGTPPPPLVSTAWQLVAGGLVLAPVAFAVEGAPPALDAAAVGGYAYLAVVGTALAYALWFRGLAALPAGATSFLSLLSPVVAVLAGWLVLGQALTLTQALGVATVLAAVLTAARAAILPTPQPTPAPRPTTPTSGPSPTTTRGGTNTLGATTTPSPTTTVGPTTPLSPTAPLGATTTPSPTTTVGPTTPLSPTTPLGATTVGQSASAPRPASTPRPAAVPPQPVRA